MPGNCDGVCRFFNPFEGLFSSTSDVAKRVGKVFDLYIDAASRPDGTGKPTAEQIDRMWQGFSATFCADFRSWNFTALRIMLGWDLAHGALDESGPAPVAREMFLAHIADPEATPALLRAAKQGIVDAITAKSADLVEQPLADFWSRFPNYRPAHIGNCYPHGHTGYRTALECQTLHLRALINVLLIAGGWTRPEAAVNGPDDR
jgi:hypothetical protein